MIRQFELVERVQSYDPDADEDVLNRAYVYAAEGARHADARLGDPYFSHPVEVAGILAEMQLDTASIVTGLLHDTVEDTDATRDEIDRPVRRGDRPAGRRRHQAVAPRAAVRAAPSRPRTSASWCWRCRRTSACCWSSSPTGCTTCARCTYIKDADAAPAHRARDDGDLRAARRAHRHGDGQGRARGAGLRRAQSRRPRHRSLARLGFLRERGERLVPRDRAPS